MKEGYSAVAINIPVDDPEKMGEFQAAMNDWQDEIVKHEQQVASDLNISDNCASNVVYLRGRSRWTQELEDELIRMDQAEGTQPNMCEYGH